MKAHRSNRSNRPEPVARENLNLFEFGFEFNRFPPVTGLTGPVNRYRRAAVRPVRSDFKTLLSSTGMMSESPPLGWTGSIELAIPVCSNVFFSRFVHLSNRVRVRLFLFFLTKHTGEGI